MIVNAKQMVKKARENGYAIGHINTNNLEWTKLILEVSQELKSPVIIGASEGAIKYMGGYKVVADLVRNLHDGLNITVPVVIHLDHGSYEGCYKAIEAGFTSVMFDGSHLPFEENYKKTMELVQFCRDKDISVEAEVGTIGGEEDGIVGNGEIASPDEAKKMVQLGIDILAAGIGNIHGPYPKNWKSLDFEALKNIDKATLGFPLVLHGGTGIPEDQITKAISLGIAKINVNTELQLAFADGTRKYIESNKDREGKGYDPRKLLKPGVEEAKNTVREKFQLFGSVNKA